MLPEEVTKFIDKAGDVRVFEVAKGAVWRFANAVGDQNPLYYDEEYARKSRYGSIIAPPGFFGSPLFVKPKSGAPSSDPERELDAALVKAGFSNPGHINAGEEYEFFRPVRAGDILAATTMITELREREGRAGKMVFIVRETTYVNQNGDLVAKARNIGMRR